MRNVIVMSVNTPEHNLASHRAKFVTFARATIIWLNNRNCCYLFNRIIIFVLKVIARERTNILRGWKRIRRKKNVGFLSFEKQRELKNRFGNNSEYFSINSKAEWKNMFGLLWINEQKNPLFPMEFRKKNFLLVSIDHKGSIIFLFQQNCSLFSILVEFARFLSSSFTCYDLRFVLFCFFF